MRTYSTRTRSILELADWLRTERVELVVMEATGDYWKPPFYLLEDEFACWLLDAKQVKHLPGRPRTDREDAIWLAKVVERGMARPSFVPPKPIRQLRDLTRYRPDHAVGELVSGLRARAVRIPGVNGEVATADRFAAAWTAGSPLRATPAMRLRLYVLGTLRPPTPPPPGRPRRAGQADFAGVAGWFTAFQSEGGVHAVDVGPVVRDRIEAGLVWLWEDTAGTAVSIAARNRTAAGVARVAPVYTPPEHRRHGYGTAVTAACTRVTSLVRRLRSSPVRLSWKKLNGKCCKWL